jgi:hypothetical protein
MSNNKAYDFDIQNYSIKDLENLFQLPKDKSYSVDDVKIKKQDFYERIMASTSQAPENRRFLRRLNKFLDEACHLLVYMISPNKTERGDQERPQERPQEIVLDYYNNVRALTTSRQYTSPTSTYYDRSKNELLEPNRPEFQMVMTNDFNPGKINPLHTPVITKCLNVDTRFRDNLYTTQSSDFTFTLPTKIRKVVSMQLSAYEFPVTFYGTSASYGNNFLNVFCTYYNTLSRDVSAVALKTIIIPDGNYSAQDLITYINDSLSPKNSDGSLMYTNLDSSGIFNCVTLSLDLNENGSGTGKVTIGTQTIAGYYDPTLYIISLGLDFTLDKTGAKDLINPTSKLGWNLGFIRPKYYGSSIYVSDTLPDPAAIRYLYLVVNDFNNSVNNHFVGAFNNWILNDNILARIPINGQYFNILNENQLSQHLEPRKYFGPVDIQRLQIQLLDDHGRVLDINGANYSLCFTFKCLYD